MWRYLTLFLILSALIVVAESEAFTIHQGKPVTPYGDQCPRCSNYGICKTPMSHDDAKEAMIEYYHKKGLTVQVVQKNGRFIRAKIKNMDKVLDIIIFDRHTGRIRSIY